MQWSDRDSTDRLRAQAAALADFGLRAFRSGKDSGPLRSGRTAP